MSDLNILEPLGSANFKAGTQRQRKIWPRMVNLNLKSPRSPESPETCGHVRTCPTTSLQVLWEDVQNWENVQLEKCPQLSKGFHLKRILHSWIQCKECLCHLNCLPFGYNEDNFRRLRCSETVQSPVFSSVQSSLSQWSSVFVWYYHQYHLYRLNPVIKEICLTRGWSTLDLKDPSPSLTPRRKLCPACFTEG